MATLGPLYPTAASSVAGTAPETAEAWVNPTNVFSDNGTGTTNYAAITAATYDSPDVSQRLMVSGFGFNVPDGSTINGITVQIERRYAAGGAKDYRVQLCDNGSLLGSNLADTALAWPNTDTIKTYGGSANLWDATLTPALVNSPTFGLCFSVSATTTNVDIYVDYVRMTVTYTPPVASYTPVAYRFRNDDGNETTATWIDAENTDITHPLDTNLRIRFEVQNDNNVANGSQLNTTPEVRLNGGAWSLLLDSATYARPSLSPHFSDAIAATTDQLTAGTGTFVAGTLRESQTAAVISSGFAVAGSHFEHEWCLTIRSAGGVVAGDTIEIRMNTWPSLIATVTVGSSTTTVPGSFTADAYIKRVDLAGAFTADAYIKRLDLSGSFTADASIQKTTSGSFTADANIKATLAGSVTANANVKATVASSLTADAYVKRTYVFAPGGGNTTVVSDRFDGPAAYLRNHTPNSGGPWTHRASYVGEEHWVTGSGQLVHDGTFTAEDADGMGFAHAYSVAGSATDGYIDFFLGGGGAALSGATFRGSSAAGQHNYYMAGFNFWTFTEHQIVLYRVTSLSGFTSVGSYSIGGATSQWVRVEFSGTSPTTLKVKVAASQSALDAAGYVINTTDNGAQCQNSPGLVGAVSTAQYDFWGSGEIPPNRINDYTAYQTGGGGGTDGPGLTADANIAKQTSGSFTANAHVKATLAGTLTANANIKNTLSGTLTADAYIKQTLTGSLTADAYIRQTYAGAYSADAYIKKTLSGSFTADAEISAAQATTYPGSFTANAHIKAAVAGSLTADATVKNTLAGSLTADAYVKQTTSGAFTANADLKRTFSGSVTAEAYIRSTIAGTFSGAAYIQKTTAQSLTADAYIGRITAGTLSADAHIKSTVAGSFTADATIAVTGTATGSITADAFIKKTISGTLTADAYVKKTFAGTLTADANVRQTYAGSLTADAYVKRIYPQTFTANATLKATVGGSLTADAQIAVIGTGAGSFTANAYIKNTIAGSISADAYVKKTLTGALTADASIGKTTTGSLTANAHVKATLVGSVTADAYIKQTLAGFVAASAYIRATQQGSFTADAYIGKTSAGSLTANAYVKQTSLSSLTADAYLKTTFSGSFSADASVKVTTLGTFTADARISHYVATVFGQIEVDEVRITSITVEEASRIEVEDMLVVSSIFITEERVIEEEASTTDLTLTEE